VTSTAGGIVFAASKFTEGAWLLLILVPGMVLSWIGSSATTSTGPTIGYGEIPTKPVRGAESEAWSLYKFVAIAVWPA